MSLSSELEIRHNWVNRIRNLQEREIYCTETQQSKQLHGWLCSLCGGGLWCQAYAEGRGGCACGDEGMYMIEPFG